MTPKASSVRLVTRASIPRISYSSKFAKATEPLQMPRTETRRTTHFSKDLWRGNVKADATLKPSDKEIRKVAGKETVKTATKTNPGPKPPRAQARKTEVIAAVWGGRAF